MRGNSFLGCSACDKIKPSRNLSDRTKVKILKKKIFWISLKKIGFCVCSVTAEMYIEILAKIEGKEAKFFPKI